LTRLAVFGFSYACRVAGFLKIANRFLTVLWDASEGRWEMGDGRRGTQGPLDIDHKTTGLHDH
jgi:hypothetical protein